MTKPSIKALLGGTAIALVAAFALAPSAQAACWWNGYAWNCESAPVIAVTPYQGVYGYPQYGGFYSPGYIRAPQTDFRYPGPSVH